jgi:hypothetical protein
VWSCFRRIRNPEDQPTPGPAGRVPPTTGWDPIRIAKAWVVLMKRLGYTRYVAQGGDWGNAVTEQMALLGAPELIGIHTNMPATVPPDIDKAAFSAAPPPSDLSGDEKHAYEQLAFFYKHGLGYAKRWRTGRRRCTHSQIHRSAWRPG